MKVTPKKHLGQHFLTDLSIAQKIAFAGDGFYEKANSVLEIGPGTGALTKFLDEKLKNKLWLNEIDRESIAYLNIYYPHLSKRIIETDFLKLSFENLPNPIHVAGNFPYNISSQIVFHIIHNRDKVHSMHGMFQKEVAERICAQPGSKTYGILSVLTQAWFEVEYLFSVAPGCFNPPPKVQSGVMSMQLKKDPVKCTEKALFTVVKTAFNQRRKTLGNSLKSLGFSKEHPLAGERPEKLTVQQFEELTVELF